MCEVIEIRTVNLGNADSHIVVLKKRDEILILLIDMGRPSHLSHILNELKDVLHRYGKPGPDLVICTHYDYDHIGGLEEIVWRYRIHIREVWMHKTSQLIEIAERLDVSPETSSIILIDEDDKELTLATTGIIDFEDDDIQGLLRQLKHEVSALKALQEMSIEPKEPIAGRCEFEGWPEIKVIGPTYEYYQSLFPDHFDMTGFVRAEKAALMDSVGSSEHLDSTANPFDRLDQVIRSALTATNLNSAIIQITAVQGKFLFTGDSGIESFYKVPDYKTEMADLHFLKVPHHGSANNLNSELVKLFNPQVAFVPGGSHVSKEVVYALQEQGTQVYITAGLGGALTYPIAD